MRHRVAHRKLGRVTEHRLAMLRNQAQALLRHERIETTVPRAKELRPFVERIISIAKRSLVDGGNGRTVHARRLVRRDIVDRDIVTKLFDSIAPRFAERPGGYTRILKLGFRRGDAAEVAQVELVGSEYNPKAATAKSEEAAPKPKGVGGRLRAAASRLRGKREKPAESEEGKAAKEAKAARAEASKAKSATAAKSKAATRGAGSKKMG